MPKGVPRNLTDAVFGKLLVLQQAESRRFPKGGIARYWSCRCVCGVTKEIQADGLLSGAVVSCGCHKTAALVASQLTHGKWGSPVYGVYRAMHNRCYNETFKQYKDYGGRGITVCKRWHVFENFYADMGDPPPRLTLERKDNNKGYNKRNCKWATYKEQAQNRRPRNAA